MQAFDDAKPSMWLANDPVLGRMICPALTRLNLEKKVSEPLILKSVHIDRPGAKTVTWVLGLRTGIYWWNGQELEAKDVADFLQKNLATIVKEKGSDLWTLPNFSITADKEFVRITFNREPEFGPYVLNGSVLWRERASKDPIKFECVGRFVPQKESDHMKLVPNRRYQHETKSYLMQDLQTFHQQKLNGLGFRMADDQPTAPDKRKVFETAPCDCLVDLPTMNAVLWFENNPLLSDVKVRKRLSSLFPREALLGIGSGYWGTLPSSVIPKDHPGYSSERQVPDFVLTRATERKPLFLSTMRGKVGLVEKVLSDNLLVGGFDVQFVQADDKRLDGLITGLFLPWPEMDLYDAFHSKGKRKLGYRKTNDAELDRELDHYRRSLTLQTPDFSALKHVHKRLHDLEWISVLAQNKACIEFSGLTKKKSTIDSKDPDWFLNLL